MAAPQFSAPGSVSHSRPKRRFTLAEANRALPLVQRIVNDIVKTHALATRLQKEVERQSSAKHQQQQQQASIQGQLDACTNKLEDFVDELSEIGCELKDYQAGLIDFVGRHEGRDVYLCWKLGEDRIMHWHELDSGFAGRQPVGKLHETK